MQMPDLGASIVVRPTSPNVEQFSCTGRFLPEGEWTAVTVNHHIASRILDGAVEWRAKAPASPVAVVKGEK